MPKPIREMPRGRNKRTPHPVVIIVCEGAKTEPTYFEKFKKRDKPLRIEIVKGAKGTSYQAVINMAVEAKEKHVGNTETKWTVWCVSDVDADPNTPYSQSSKNDQLSEYAKEAAVRGFNVALSNPCFEIWFLLHFTYTTGHLQNYDAVVKKLFASEYLPGYQKNSDIFGVLADKQDTAINHAKKLKVYHAEQGRVDYMDCSANPYTNVWEIVESLK
ncbi:MAG: RloB family protein [Defluviitaleaceae bacterium]|nr:RloB family protein [Defluviitaleaceae bacterium]